ncbi:hypothetical protein N0V82_010510 [Gnomoniopsis sp. IMI 355080]|nr:hypothetical protein N0V82_010510 [Gnomoniopsis sp. IMI 355080]
MPKAISICANEAQASFVGGPRFMTQQPSIPATVVIAVVASSPGAEAGTQGPLVVNDKFLALLSTESHPENPYLSSESEARRMRRKYHENSLRSIRHSRCCQRYMNMLRDRNASRWYRNSEHFCATGGHCSHGPAPSTFPGTKSWTFAAGEASFDESRMSGFNFLPYEDSPAPHVTDADRALDILEGLLRTAVDAGVTGLKVVVSASDVVSSDLHGTELEEFQELTSRALHAVVGWVERRWVARDQLDVMWLPFGTTRNFGVLGSQKTPPFVIHDEG